MISKIPTLYGMTNFHGGREPCVSCAVGAVELMRSSEPTEDLSTELGLRGLIPT